MEMKKQVFSFAHRSPFATFVPMKMKFLLFLLLGGLFLACGGHANFERRLSEADTLMSSRPDSAYRMLCAMNDEADSVSTALRMRYWLLRCNAQNKSDVLFTSDSVGRLLTAYYDRHGSPNERMLAHYMQGCAYRDMQDWPSAVRCFNDAVAAADTAAVDCDFEQLSIIYGQIAFIFENQYLIEEALQAYNSAERYAQDTLSLLNVWEHKADALIKKGEIDEGLRIKEKVIYTYKSLGYFREAARTIGLCIKWYARQGHFKKAESAINEYESMSGFFLENGDIRPGKEDYYHIKGSYYEEKGELDSAEHYFRKLQYTGKDLNSQYLATWGLNRIFYAKNQPDSIAKYAKLNMTYNDSLYNNNVAQNLQRYQAMYNYSHHQETALRKDMEAKETRIQLLYVVVVGTILLFSLAFLILFLGRKRRLHRIRIRRRMHTRLTEKSAKERELNERIAENKQLIASLNKQLDDSALELEKGEQMKKTIRILEDKIGKYQTELNAFTRSQHAARLEEEPTIVQFIEIARRGKEQPSKEEWHKVRMLVEEHYPKMVEIRELKYVSRREYDICILLKLGLDLQSIKFLVDADSINLSAIRRRMLEKIFGTKGSTKEFDRRLMEEI